MWTAMHFLYCCSLVQGCRSFRSRYDFTTFIDEHPGGVRGLLRHAGTDASEVFAELHSQSIFAAFGPKCALRVAFMSSRATLCQQTR